MKNIKKNKVVAALIFLTVFSLAVCLSVFFIIFNRKTKPSEYDPSDYRYGVFLSYEGKLEELKEYETIVIDAQYYSAKEIKDFTADNHYVLSYINVGALEDFRDYYDEYKNLELGEYEHWDEEIWIDVSDERWQEFILDELAPELAEKGISGFFVDNCDVYYNYPSAEILDGLSLIMEGLRDTGLKVIINGGDTFLDAYTESGKDCKNVVTGINQETVLSRIKWETETFGRNSREDREYFEDYIDKYAKEGIDIYLLEYTDGSLDNEIKDFCHKKNYLYYISDSLELDYP